MKERSAPSQPASFSGRRDKDKKSITSAAQMNPHLGSMRKPVASGAAAAKFVVPPSTQVQIPKKPMQRDLFDPASLLGPPSASKLQHPPQIPPPQHGIVAGGSGVPKDRRSYSLTTKKETRKGSKKREVDANGAQFPFTKKGESPVRKKTSGMSHQPMYAPGIGGAGVGGGAYVGGIGRTALAVGYPKG